MLAEILEVGVAAKPARAVAWMFQVECARLGRQFVEDKSQKILPRNRLEVYTNCQPSTVLFVF